MITIEHCKICGSQNIIPFLDLPDYFLSQEIFKISKCSDCGFKFTNPHPNAEAINAYYKSEDYVSHSETKKGLFFKLYHIIKKRALNSKKNLIEDYFKNGRILDYGCGTGDFVGNFSSDTWERFGMEPDDKTRAYAAKKHNIRIGNTDTLSSFEPEFFDVITLWHVLEHIPDLQEKIRHFSSLLKPDGIIVIAVPNSDSHDAKYYEKYWAAYDVPRHLHHFNKSTFQMLSEKCGFGIVGIKPMVFDSFYVSMLSEKYKKSFLSFLKGVFLGFVSNFKARYNKGNFSSLIFILRKKG